MRSYRNLAYVALLAVSLLSAPQAVVATDSAALMAAKACRTALTNKGKSYANKRRRLILGCIDRLLKCELKREVGDGGGAFNYGTCHSGAVSACNLKIASLATAATTYHDATVVACVGMGVTNMCSTGSGGLWFGNDATCGTSNANTCGGSADLSTLVSCIRDEIEEEVDQDVGRVQPRGGLLADAAGIGSSFDNLPRPPVKAVQVDATAPGSGILVNDVGDGVGTITLAAGTVLKVNGGSSLSCGGGMNGHLTVSAGTGTSCSDIVVEQQATLKEPYGLGDVAFLGPFETDRIYCFDLKDGGGMGGCMDKVSGTIDLAGGGTDPSSSSASLLACQNRFEAKVKALARMEANKLHSCADKVVRCKLANEIDAVDPTACLNSAATTCNAIKVAIETKIAAFKDPLKITGIPKKCIIPAYADLQPFTGGLGFENANAPCSGQTNLNNLMDCVLGVPGGMVGTKCDVEHKVFIRDPRALNSLSNGAPLTITPATDFPCLGP